MVPDYWIRPRHDNSQNASAVAPALAEVRDAAGRANVSITSAYLHVAVEDDAVGNLGREAAEGVLFFARDFGEAQRQRTGRLR